MKLKITKYPEGRSVKTGTITYADILKKFNLPLDAELEFWPNAVSAHFPLDADIFIKVRVETT